MADIKISELTEADPLDGTEDLPIVQDAATVRCSTQDIADLASVKTAKVTASSAAILASNTTPVQILPAPGAGKFIEVLRVYYKLNFGTVAYDTNTSWQILLGGAGGANYTSNTNFLATGSTALIRPTANTSAINTDPVNYENLALVAYASGGNPANGDSTVDIYVVYQILDIS